MVIVAGYLALKDRAAAPGNGDEALLPGAGNGESVACTLDAKVCPDGRTYVSRVPPTCEFAACPTALETDIPIPEEWQK